MVRSGQQLLIRGVCEPGYEPVRQLFESHLETGKDENAQLCIYVDNKCVVDLTGSSIGDESYSPESLHLIYSSGKSVMSFVMAMQVEKGLLNYKDKVSKLWPAFGQHGKADLTVADVLRHEAGMNALHESLDKSSALRSNIKLNAVGKVIEDTQSNFPPNNTSSRREYHYVTRGLILNEVLRRVDPLGRTLGEILRQEVGIDGIHCGLEEGALARIATQREATLGWSYLQAMFGKKTCLKSRDMMKMTMPMLTMAGKIRSRNPWFVGQTRTAHPFFSQELIRRCEIPSAGVHANARGLAKLASVLANKGQPINEGEQRLISEQTWEQMHSEPTTVMDAELQMRTRFTLGGVNYFAKDFKVPQTTMEGLMGDDREGYYGWMGYGGSVFQWHPKLKIGFAYVPTLLQPVDTHNLRGAKLQKVAADCARNLNTAVTT